MPQKSKRLSKADQIDPNRHLRFSMGPGVPRGHPEQVMADLGITYQHGTPQTIGDQWWFWNCCGVPDPLPGFLTPLNFDPLDAIGYGLSRTVAISIAAAEHEDEPAPAPRRIYLVAKAGRCATGSQRDGGTVGHWKANGNNRALCGTAPGRLSSWAAWGHLASDYDNLCLRCAAKVKPDDVMPEGERRP